MLLAPQHSALPATPTEYDEVDQDDDEPNMHEILFGYASGSAAAWRSEHQAQYTFVRSGAAPGVLPAPQQVYFAAPQLPPPTALFSQVAAAPAAAPLPEAVLPPEPAAPQLEPPAASGGERPRTRGGNVRHNHEFHTYGRANTRPTTGGFFFG